MTVLQGTVYVQYMRVLLGPVYDSITILAGGSSVCSLVIGCQRSPEVQSRSGPGPCLFWSQPVLVHACSGRGPGPGLFWSRPVLVLVQVQACSGPGPALFWSRSSSGSGPGMFWSRSRPVLVQVQACSGPGLFWSRPLLVQVQFWSWSRHVLVQVPACSGPGPVLVQVQACYGPGTGLFWSRSVLVQVCYCPLSCSAASVFAKTSQWAL